MTEFQGQSGLYHLKYHSMFIFQFKKPQCFMYAIKMLFLTIQSKSDETEISEIFSEI